MDATAPPTLSPAHTLRGHEHAVYDCAVASDGSVALSCSEGKNARVWDLRKGGATRVVLRGHSSPVWQCALSADGAVAATASMDGSVSVWDAETGSMKCTLRRYSLNIACGCVLSADGSLLIASFRSVDEKTGQVVFYDWKKDQIVHKINRSCGVLQCSASRDATKVAFLSRLSPNSYEVEVVDRNCRTTRLIRCSGDADVAMTHSGSHIAIVDERHLRLFDVQLNGEPTVMQGYQRGKHPYCAVTANGSHIVATAPDDSYCVWDTTRRSVVAVLRGHTDCIRGCSISDDGSCIITCSSDRTVRVWITSTSTAAGIGPAREPACISVTASVFSKHRINPDIRYDLFISFYGNEELCSGITARDVAHESRNQAFEQSGQLASIFYDEDVVRGCYAAERLQAILQTRGGGTVLFLLTKEYLKEPKCLAELRAILNIRTRGRDNDDGEKLKIRFVCFGSSVDEVLGCAQDIDLYLGGHVIECIPQTTREEMGSAIAGVVDRAWREERQTVFGKTALVSFIQLAKMFREDVVLARLLLKVSGSDILTVMDNAMKGPNFDLHRVDLLRQIAALSGNKLAVGEKQKAVKAYAAKWVDSRRWSWTVEEAIGAKYLPPG